MREGLGLGEKMNHFSFTKMTPKINEENDRRAITSARSMFTSILAKRLYIYIF